MLWRHEYRESNPNPFLPGASRELIPTTRWTNQPSENRVTLYLLSLLMFKCSMRPRLEVSLSNGQNAENIVGLQPHFHVVVGTHQSSKKNRAR